MGQQSGTFQSTWVDVNGLPVHTVVSTEPGLPGAPTVVLVHGLGLSHRYMVPIAARLAPVYRVYIPDLPGFGDSGKPSRVLDVPGLADALAAWMRTLGLGRAALFGNSFGCQIIVDLAARWMVGAYPQRRFPAVAIGSSNGALVHLCAALGIPWLPQTFLIPVRQSSVHPDDPQKSLEAAIAPVRALLRRTRSLCCTTCMIPTRIA